MSRFLAAWIFIVGTLAIAQAQMLAPIVNFGKPRSSNNLSIDGSVSGASCAGVTTGTATLSTTKTNDIIVVGTIANSGGPLGATPVVDTAGLTWHRVSSGTKANLWWALASSPLSSDIITFTNNSSATVVHVMAFAVNGANTSSPLDPNGALPVSAATGDVSVSTTNNFTIPVAVYSSGTSLPTAGSGFTGLATSGCFSIMEYKIVSTPQSSLDMSLTVGAGGQNGGLGDAVTQ